MEFPVLTASDGFALLRCLGLLSLLAGSTVSGSSAAVVQNQLLLPHAAMADIAGCVLPVQWRAKFDYGQGATH